MALGASDDFGLLFAIGCCVLWIAIAWRRGASVVGGR